MKESIHKGIFMVWPYLHEVLPEVQAKLIYEARDPNTDFLRGIQKETGMVLKRTS